MGTSLDTTSYQRFCLCVLCFYISQTIDNALDLGGRIGLSCCHGSCRIPIVSKDRIRSVLEQSKSEQVQEQRTAGWNTALWVRENTPKDAKISFFLCMDFLGDGTVSFSGAEEHIPTREWVEYNMEIEVWAIYRNWELIL